MTITEISHFPTSLTRQAVIEANPTAVGFHESLLRSFHIVDKLRSLLKQDTPAPVILEMLDVMEHNYPEVAK